MKKYDVYGIGNALVDTEYEVDDEFIAATRWQKGIMTLIEANDRVELIHLLEQEHERQVIKLAGGGSAANTIVIVAQLGGAAFYSCKVANDKIGARSFTSCRASRLIADSKINAGRKRNKTSSGVS